jgi:hypothetical protein
LVSDDGGSTHKIFAYDAPEGEEKPAALCEKTTLEFPAYTRNSVMDKKEHSK